MWVALRRLNTLVDKKLVVGDYVEAKWTDGLTLAGYYQKTERGYIILVSEEGKQIACNPSAVKFRILNERR